jgi:hypothetical protein
LTATKGAFFQAQTYSAVDIRRVTSAVIGGRAFESLSPAVGPIGRGHGVLSGDAMLVTPTGSPDNQVHVAAGMCAVRGTQADSQGSYLCTLDATFDLTVPPKHSSLTTNHYVVAQVKDNEYAAFTGNLWVPEIVAGTPGAGNPAVPEDCLVLAGLTIPGGTGSTLVTSTNITDLRPHARATGGIMPVNARADLVNPQSYEVIWETSTSQLLIRIGSSWVTIGRNLDANWQTYTPTFGGVIGPYNRYGRYQRYGRTILGVAGFELINPANVNAGINCSLPVPCYNPGATIRYMAAGRAFIGTQFFSCTAEINPSFNPNLITHFATAGLPEWGNPSDNPANWGLTGTGFNTSQLRIFFNYEAA